MKLPESDIYTEVGGATFESYFGVGDSAILFDILRTKIYKNPILAIVREIASNARDAHREAELHGDLTTTQNTPIEIHVPNSLSPVFKVIDFGPGISHSRMTDIFTKYGSSTKRGDNIQTGGFGLGCKTPFSYGDNFTITSICEGKKRIYNAFIDETKVGKVVLLSEQDCNDHTGTTISVPVKKDDFQTFISNIKNVFKYWSVKPILSGQPEYFEWESENVIMSGSDWRIVSEQTSSRKNYYYHRNDAIILIDEIQYSIDTDSFSNEYKSQDEFKLLLNTDIRINFAIGEISLSASRDSIHYDDRTQKKIFDKVREIYRYVKQNCVSKIESAKTFFEACFLFGSLSNELSFFGAPFFEQIKWNNILVFNRFSNSKIASTATLSIYKKDSSGLLAVYGIPSRKAKQYGVSVNWPIKDSNKVKFYLQDDKKNTAAKIAKIFKEDPQLEVLQVIKYIDGDPSVNSELLNLLISGKLSDISISNDEKKDLVNSFFYRESSERAKYNRTKIEEGKIHGYELEFSYNRTKFVTKSLDPVSSFGDYVYIIVDYKENELFFPVSGKEIYRGRAEKLQSIIKRDGKLFVGLTKIKEKKVKNLSNWISLDDYLSKKLVDIITKANLDCLKRLSDEIYGEELKYNYSNIKNCDAYSNYGWESFYDLLVKEMKQDSSMAEHALIKYQEECKVVETEKQDAVDAKNIIMLIDNDKYLDIISSHPVQSPRMHLKNYYDNIREKYPCLILFDPSQKEKRHIKEIVNYIKLVDSQEEKS